jgi:hypothetical protein
MTAPTKSSLRSAERLSHQPTETGSGGCEARDADFPFAAGVLLFPCEEVTVLPLVFPLDLEAEEGVLRGIRLPLAHKPLKLQEMKRHDQISCLIVYAVIESIAQMVWFSFAAQFINRS